MKKTRINLAILSILLLCAMMLNLSGCVMEVQAKDLMDGIMANSVDALDDLSAQNTEVTDFAVRLFKACEESGQNTLISPLSVLCALSMTANGAKDETLEQMESVIGMSTEEMNLYFYSYINSLPQSEEYKLSLANSVWFTDHERFTVNREFLQTNADYYMADIYQTPFNRQTCNDINNWVKEKTDGMIPKVLEEIPADAVMYLVNALAFEAEWRSIYEKHQVRDGEFTKEDGSKQKTEFMYGAEGMYLENENATGFIKHYKGGKYAFAAMLPNEGVSVSDFIASLDGDSVSELLRNPQYATVHTAIPKFESEYAVEMSEILKKMGMTDAFDENKADFEGLGTSSDGNVFVSAVLHKTFISVGEKGTKAGAVTVVELSDTAADIGEQEPKQVYLDRPFVYMLVDCKNNIPFFIGTMMDVKQ